MQIYGPPPRNRRPGQLSRYSNSLRHGRSGDRIPVEGDVFRTRPDRLWGPPRPLYNGYRVFTGGKAAGAWCWTPPHLQCRGLKLGTAIPLSALWALVVCYRENLYLYLPEKPSSCGASYSTATFYFRVHGNNLNTKIKTKNLVERSTEKDTTFSVHEDEETEIILLAKAHTHCPLVLILNVDWLQFS